MYVSLEKAKKTLWSRRSAPHVRQKVQEYVGEIPPFLQQEPRAVLARQLATPNFELLSFSETAPKTGLKPIVIEYTGDKFCSNNRDKLLLGKMTFFHGKARESGHDTIICHRIIDFNQYDGRTFTEIRTLWGEDFVGFHHRLLFQNSPGIETTDVTAWLERMGGEPGRFWPRLFALFICHGILFDNFHTDGHEAEFTRKIIYPAIRETEDRFGLKPLVIPLVPLPREQEAYWSWYPGSLENEIRCLTKQRKAELPARSGKRCPSIR